MDETREFKLESGRAPVDQEEPAGTVGAKARMWPDRIYTPGQGQRRPFYSSRPQALETTKYLT